MKSPLKSFLTAAFLAAALIVPAQQAQAFTPMHMLPAVHVVVTNTAAQSAARRHRQEQAVDAVIANPSAAAVREAVGNGGLESTLVPYIGAVRGEMKLPVNVKAKDVTFAMRNQFLSLAKEHRLAAEVTAPSKEAAEKLGLDSSLSKYLTQAQAEARLTSGQDASPQQIKVVYDLMAQKHWENDTKPALIAFGSGLGVLGIGAAAAAGFAVRRITDGCRP
jgi:hypothetical protein